MRAPFSFFSAWSQFFKGATVTLALLVFAPFLIGQDTAPLRVGVDSDYPPYEWVDATGQCRGYNVELLRTVAKSQNLTLDFHPMSWRRLRGAFDRGEIDILTGMAASERRVRTIDFSIPHSTSIYSILHRQRETRIRSERDLAGMTILSEEGDVLHEYLVGQGLKVQGVNSPREALVKLAGGQGDCAVVPKLMWLYQEKAQGLRNLRIVPSELFPTKYCFAVPKGRETLLAKLNKGLFLAKQSGAMDALSDRYLGSLEAGDLSLKTALRRVMPGLFTGILAAGLLIVLGWSLALRRAVKLKTAALQATIGELEGAWPK